MQVLLAYCFPTVAAHIYEPLARRFAQSYMEHPPGDCDHRIVVLVNGYEYPGIRKVFDPLPVELMQHDNSGRDLGAYLKAAWTIDADFMLCLGAPVFFHKAGWLDCMVNAHLDNGPGIFGCFGAQAPMPHLRTTGFGITPELLKSYPNPITTESRYLVEHGSDSLSLWVGRIGFQSLQVAWSGVFAKTDWHQPLKKDCLMRDQHCENYYGD